MFAHEVMSSSLVATSAQDLVLSGGAQVTADPLNSLRSGNPGQHSVASFILKLSVGAVLQHVSFDYRYNIGFGGSNCTGSNFSVRAAGATVYRSPHLKDYSYDKNRTNYSSPISVDVTVPSVPITATDARLEILFDNNDRNMQLLLPLNLTLRCTNGPCVAVPLVPSFIDSNMVLQRAPASATIWGHTAMAGETVSARLDHLQPWTTTAAADGGWSIKLDPQPASSNTTVTLNFSRTGRHRVLRNVAFGDVYLCSGNSNLTLKLWSFAIAQRPHTHTGVCVTKLLCSCPVITAVHPGLTI